MNKTSISVFKIIPDELITSKGKISTRSSITKVFGIYFTASWCPPCKAFDQILKNCYKSVNEKEKQFEIIMSSSDEDKDEFDEHLKELPWASIPFEDKSIDLLIKCFGIQGVPCLLVFNEKGKLIEKLGRQMVQNKGAVAIENWLGNKNKKL